MRKYNKILSIIFISLSVMVLHNQCSKRSSRNNNSRISTSHLTGFYLVIAEADSASSLPKAKDDQQIVYYDYKYLLENERGKPRFLLISKSPDVALMLSSIPELIEKSQNGFPELLFKLTPEASIALEELTREHLGGKIAFLINNEPVTLHKIKSTIVGGQFQLTRCTDTACRVIYGRLLQSK
jgi:hypothetical protein